MTKKGKVYTSYYGNIKKLMANKIMPVGISIYPPKYFNGTSYFVLAPTRDMLGMEYDEYKAKYIRLLEERGVDRILQDLNTIADGKDIALLCYESLKKEDEWCHRTMFAEYVKEKAGFEVIEFEEPKKIEPPKQLEMF
jgi:hypothetical protein